MTKKREDSKRKKDCVDCPPCFIEEVRSKGSLLVPKHTSSKGRLFERSRGVEVEFLLRNPFLRTFMALSAGIILADKGFVQHHLLLIVSAIVLTGLYCYYKYSKGALSERYEYAEPLASVVLLFLVLSLGAAVMTLRQEKDRGSIVQVLETESLDEQGRCCLMEVRGKVVKGRGRVRVPARIRAYSADNTEYRKAEGNIMLTLYDVRAGGLEIGDRICVKMRINRPQATGNPESFDYVNYLKRQGYWWEGRAGEGEWIRIGAGTGRRWLRCASKLQDKLTTKLEKICRSGSQEERGMLSALIFGERSSLSDEIKESYGNAGIMHVLAVSGLHVGIVGGFVLFLLGLLPGGWRHPVKMFSAVLAVWCYAFVTGGAAPVLRAAFMFTLFVVGWSIGRRQQPINTLCLAAFLMLLISPNDLFTASFQLSYSAIFGIIVLYQKIRGLVHFSARMPQVPAMLLGKAWDLTAVGLAAQAGLFPLLLYYFDKIGIYSVLFSVIVVPIATLIIWAAIVTFSLSFIPMVVQGGGVVLLLLASWENAMAKWIEHLPGSVWWHATSEMEVVLLYIVLFLVLGCLYRRRAVWLILTMIVLCILVTADIRDRTESSERKNWVVYYQYGQENLSLDFVDGQHHTLITNNAGQVERIAKKWWLRLRCDAMDTLSVGEKPMFLAFAGERIAIIRDGMCVGSDGETCATGVDYLVVGGRVVDAHRSVETCMTNVREVIRTMKPKTVIVAVGVGVRKTKQWAEACEEKGIEFYALRERGAFIREEVR